MEIMTIVVWLLTFIGLFTIIERLYMLGCKLTEKIKALIKNKKRKEKN